MGFDNPPVRWKELEARLSGRARQGGRGDGNDAPAWSSKRPPSTPPAALTAPRSRPVGAVPYAELHCHSNFSFLDGASHPEELVEEATRLGLEALALTDHDGLYGVVRFAEAAREVGMPTIFGAEVTLDLPAAPPGGAGVADPAGTHVVVLARDPVGYTRLARAL
ncbi:PHP domain-containing protein, partial [Acidimicrobiaceae bacterium USS-CC1]|nr:PHP domain-containing protein [Acidiferrimicrobium australe]